MALAPRNFLYSSSTASAKGRDGAARQYGYRRITALLRTGGWTVNKKRVERIWRCEGLKVPAKQPKRSRLWLNDGSCVRLRPQRPNHVWSYDFVADRTHDGRAYRMLCIIDEFTRESLAIRVARKLKATDVIEALCDLFVTRGIPAHIRSDNGPEFVAVALRHWIAAVGARTAGTVRIFVFEAVIRHAFTKRSLNMTANCVFASAHSRGGRFHSAAAWFKTKYSSLAAASSDGKCPLVRTARRSFEFNASIAFVV